MKIRGYLERGIINSIYHEIKYAEKSNELTARFISLIKFLKYRQDLGFNGARVTLSRLFPILGRGMIWVQIY